MAMMAVFFDLNFDGKVSDFERSLAMKLISGLDELEEASAAADELLQTLRDKLAHLEEERSGFQEELSVLEDELYCISGNEPATTSPAFDRWVQRHTLLEDQISEVEERLDDLDRQITELSSQLNDAQF
jgi:chromosome segregation ATPase